MDNATRAPPSFKYLATGQAIECSSSTPVTKAVLPEKSRKVLGLLCASLIKLSSHKPLSMWICQYKQKVHKYEIEEPEVNPIHFLVDGHPDQVRQQHISSDKLDQPPPPALHRPQTINQGHGNDQLQGVHKLCPDAEHADSQDDTRRSRSVKALKWSYQVPEDEKAGIKNDQERGDGNTYG